MLNKIISVFSGFVNKVATLANAVGTLVVIGLVAIVNYDIFARGLFNLPFRGAYEVVQFSMILIVFLQLPDVVKAGRLTRSDGLLGLIRFKFPKVYLVLNAIINVISATIMALITLAIFPEFIEMWETKDYFGVPGVFTAPYWPIKLTILCSTALCTIIFILKVIHNKKPASSSTKN